METETALCLSPDPEMAHRSSADYARDNWEPGTLDCTQAVLRRTDTWGLALTLEDERTWLDVRVVKAFPLTKGDTWIAFLNRKNDEIGTICSVDELEPFSRQLAADELNARYLVGNIQRVLSLRSEGDTLYWEVETQRGKRDFVIRANRETMLRPDDRRLVLIDVDGNRFEIPDMTKLDSNSLAIVQTVV